MFLLVDLGLESLGPQSLLFVLMSNLHTHTRKRINKFKKEHIVANLLNLNLPILKKRCFCDDFESIQAKERREYTP